MAWHLFGAKPLPEPMMILFYQIDTYKQTSLKFELYHKTFVEKHTHIWKLWSAKHQPFFLTSLCSESEVSVYAFLYCSATQGVGEISEKSHIQKSVFIAAGIH